MTADEPLKGTPLWGGLKSGPYGVGFSTEFRFDHARVYGRSFRDRDEEASPKRPRPILVHCWYPTAPSSAQGMRYEEYLQLDPNHPDLQLFIERLIHFNRDVIASEVFRRPWRKLNAGERDAFERLMKTQVPAVRGAPPSEGPFPLVINHPGLGGAFEDNAVLFEYLASHGYVVVNSAYPPENAARVSIDWDLERSFRDLEFLVNVLESESNVDRQRVAVMGQSYGGQAALAWRSEKSSVVDAVVSFDATVEYAPRDSPGFKPFWDKVGRVRQMTAPMLLFAQESGSPRFDHYDDLRYADRYCATVRHLGHNDFLSHGAIGSDYRLALKPDVSEEPPIRESYERVCLTTLQFLNAVLKGDGEAQGFLEDTARGAGSDTDNLTLEIKPRVLVPPDEGDLITCFTERGSEATLSLCRRYREELSEYQLNIAAMELVERGQAAEAVELLRLNAEWHPEAVHVFDGLGRAYAAMGDASRALEAYQKELELIPGSEMSEEEKAEKVKDVTEKLERVQSSPNVAELVL